MAGYAVLIFIVIATIPFYPYQLSLVINLVIFVSSLLLLPLLKKELSASLKQKELIILIWILFLAILTLATIFSIDKSLSLQSLLFYLSAFIYFLISTKVLSDNSLQEKLSLLVIIVVTILSIISLYNTLIRHFVDFSKNGTSFLWIYFGHNHLSSLLIFAVPLAIYFLGKYWKKMILRIFYLFLFIFLSFSLFFTFARGSIISLIVSAGIASYIFNLASKRVLALIFLLVLFLIGSYLYIMPATSSNFRLYKPNWNLSQRDLYFTKSIANFTDHPLLGTGPDTFRFIPYKAPGRFGNAEHAHNFFLQILSDAGIFGFLLACSLVYLLLYKGYKIIQGKYFKNRPLLITVWISLLASTLNSLVDYDWQLPYVFLLFWILSAIILADGKE